MRGEQNNILFPVRIKWANNFPNLSPFVPPLGLEPLQATAPKLAAQNHLKFEKSCYKHSLLYYSARQRQGRMANGGRHLVSGDFNAQGEK